jgi:hypothetical protein
MFKRTNSTNLVKELFLKNRFNMISRNYRNLVKNKNLFTFLGAQKSKERREALVTPNKPCKTFKKTIETLLNSDCNFSRKGIQILTF